MTDTPSLLISDARPSYAARLPKYVGRSLGAIAFLAAFLALDRISYLDAPRPFAVMAWNPTLGVCVAIAALWGRKSFPLIVCGALLSATLIRGFPLTVIYTALVTTLMLIKIDLILRGGEFLARATNNTLLRNREATVLLSAVPITLLTAFAHTSGLALTGLLPTEKIVETAGRLWIGDLIGIFVQTPFCMLVLALTQQKFKVTLGWAIEVLIQSVLVAGMVWFIFGLHRTDASDYFYLLFLPMIWIVLNHGLNGAIVLNMFVQASTITYLLVTGPAQSDLMFFQALAIVLVASSLTLGLSVDQSRAATQRLRTREQEVAASLKTAATSELAGTLAHELSHPIGAVSNYAVALTQLIDKTENADPALSSIASKLRQEARRAADTLRRLREFFRTGSLAMERVDLGDLVRDSITLVATRLAGRSIMVRTVIEPNTLTVLADRIQLLAVLHNLLQNAIEAVEGIHAEERYIVVSAGRRGKDAFIAVADSGPGIAADIRDHIFEALTTTKSYGLGLGLSISRSIVQAHGGRIALETAEIGGAKFVIFLPAENS